MDDEIIFKLECELHIAGEKLSNNKIKKLTALLKDEHAEKYDILNTVALINAEKMTTIKISNDSISISVYSDESVGIKIVKVIEYLRRAINFLFLDSNGYEIRLEMESHYEGTEDKNAILRFSKLISYDEFTREFEELKPFPIGFDFLILTPQDILLILSLSNLPSGFGIEITADLKLEGAIEDLEPLAIDIEETVVSKVIPMLQKISNNSEGL